jgi:hypothetical protein
MYSPVEWRSPCQIASTGGIVSWLLVLCGLSVIKLGYREMRGSSSSSRYHLRCLLSAAEHA